MIYAIMTTLCLYAASLLSACSSTPLVKQSPEWGYEKDAIALHVVSDPQLNLYQKQPHSLTVCLYHLRDPNGFNQLVDEKDGLAKLLDCGRFDPSVTYSRRLVIQPNQEIKELLDRTDGAKFIGIVAGFYLLQKEGSVKSYTIPVTEVKKGSTLVQKTEKLNIDLYLGRQFIQPFASADDAATVKGKDTP